MAEQVGTTLTLIFDHIDPCSGHIDGAEMLACPSWEVTVNMASRDHCMQYQHFLMVIPNAQQVGLLFA